MAVKIKWNLKAFRELRTDPRVADDLERRAERLAAACGEGFEVLPEQSPRNRARSMVAAQTVEAKVRNSRENTLLRNLDAAGG